MAIRITDDCINCGACEPECPNTAIYEGGIEWAWKDGTKLSGKIDVNGNAVDAEASQAPVSDEFYYIISGKCTECVGFHDEPQCAAVCPVDCCILDTEVVENKEELQNKKSWLHNE